MPASLSPLTALDVAHEIDLGDVAEELAGQSGFAAQVAEEFDTDDLTSTLAECIDNDDIAQKVADGIDNSDVAGYLDVEDIAEHIDVEQVASHVDCAAIAKMVRDLIDVGDVVSLLADEMERRQNAARAEAEVKRIAKRNATWWMRATRRALRLVGGGK